MGKKTRFALVLFLFFGVFGSVAAILWRFSPTEINAPPCAFHELFGLYCPGCGSTRALRRIMRGDLIGAFRYNPALILLSPVLLWGAACFFYDRWRGCFPYRKGSLTLAYVCLALVLVFVVARNLPFECCDWLRPPAGPCP